MPVLDPTKVEPLYKALRQYRQWTSRVRLLSDPRSRVGNIAGTICYNTTVDGIVQDPTPYQDVVMSFFGADHKEFMAERLKAFLIDEMQMLADQALSDLEATGFDLSLVAHDPAVS